MTEAATISLMIVEDDELQRVGLRAYFQDEENIELVGEFGTAAEAVVEAERLQPTVILLSLGLPELAPFDTCRRIAAVAPESRVITLGPSPVREEDVATSLMVGSSGHLPKGASRSDFVRVVRATGVGEVLEIAEVALIYLRFLSSFPEPVDLGSLTRQERTVLALISGGLNNAQIAERIGISPHTVRTHVSRTLRKLNVSSRAELGIYVPLVSMLQDDADG